LKNDTIVDHTVIELIRLHDDVLARLFAIQTLLQDLGLILPEEIQRLTEQFRKQFAADLDARFTARQEKTDATAIHLMPEVNTTNHSNRREIQPSSTETGLRSKCNGHGRYGNQPRT
jgi:hypothetical protein